MAYQQAFVALADDPKGLAAIRIWLDQFWDDALVAFQAELESKDSHD